ncbi:MAG: hypothetical protein ACL7AY_05725 [Candidatus Arsenophonus phytopathogenicus]
MGQVAFDTQEFVETLENAGLPKEQAKAISIAVRKSHEVADVATKADIVEVNRNIAAVRKDLSAEIADVRKDLSAEIAQIDKRLDFSEKRFDRLEQKFDRLQWFLLAGILGLLFKEIIPKLWGG